jgi:CubicO group peptidase (beta-lactamase class C family)
MTSVQHRIERLLQRLVAEGRERGVQVAAYRDGKLLVQAWAGIADATTGARVGPGTLFPVFSVTKGLTATLVHLLVERGLLSYETPVAEIWPEFGRQGKEGITVRQVLNHSAGVPQMPAGVGYAEVCDWDRICGAIAQLSPQWTPGTRIEYHAMTYGWILGEVLRRVDGRAFPELLRDEICRPLGITTLFAGLPASLEPIVARLEEPDAVVPPDDGQPSSVPQAILPLADWMNRRDAREACIPASNGIMNALALARHYAALLPGGVEGIELLPPARVRLATEPQHPAQPASGDYPTGWGLGYQIGEPGSLMGETAAAFGHGGYGGSSGFADVSRGLAVGLTRNLFQENDGSREILAELRRSLT